MLTLDGVCASYGTATTLRDVTFSVAPGEAVALLGRNGMGKTSTLRALMGMRSPGLVSGEIRFDGATLSRRPAYEVARRGLGYVPQGRRIFGSLTVLENLRIAQKQVRAQAGDPAGRAWSVERVCALFPHLERRRGVLGGRLSGGEQQMLAIGRALMTGPSVLVLDEPSEGLAPAMVQEVVRAVVELHREGMTVLIAEQNLALAAQVAARFVVLENGTVAADTDRGSFLADAALQARLLGVGPASPAAGPPDPEPTDPTPTAP
jgi:branched-chain amino acid transport system ATP-binding protein